MIKQTRQEMDQLIFGAGFGTVNLSWLGYHVAKFYHWIIGFFTIAIILLTVAPVVPSRFVWLWIGGYVIYFAARKLMNEEARRKFYHPAVQLVRAQIGLVAVGLLINYVGPEHNQAVSLWLLFIFVLQLTSKHCKTSIFLLTVAETWFAVFVLNANIQLLDGISFELDVFNFVTQALWIGVLAFLLHYLVRAIDARQDTISGYQLASTLSSDLEALSDLEQKWRSILETCLAVVPGQAGALWTCDHKTQKIKLLTGIYDYDKGGGKPMASDETSTLSMTGDHLMAYVAQKGEACHCIAKDNSVICQNGETVSFSCPDIFAAFDSMMIIPITESMGPQPRTMALLCIGFDKNRTPRKNLLKEYQTLLIDMVHHVKPLFYYEKHLEDLLVLQQISREASLDVELTKVLDSILEDTVNTLGFEFATISLVDDNHRVIRMVGGINVSEAWIEMSVHPLDSKDIQADIVRSGKTEIIEGWDDRFDRRIWEQCGHGDMIRVFSPIVSVEPKTHRERVIGTVEAGYRKQYRPTVDKQQVAMLKPFIDQVAIAIEKARLFDRKERRAQALLSLHSVSQAIGEARDLPRVLDQIGESAELVLGADMVMLYQYDDELHRLSEPVVFGNVYGKPPLSLMIKETGVLAKIIRERVPHYSPDALQDPYLIDTGPLEAGAKPIKRRSFTQRQNIKSFAGVPLLVNGQIVGVMCVNYRSRHLLASDEQYILELFAQQAAMAIKNARMNKLAEQLAVNEVRSRLSRDLHDSISQYVPAIKFMASNAEMQIESDPQSARKWLKKIQEAAQAALKDVSFNVFELKPVPLERGIHECLIHDAEFISSSFGLDVTPRVQLTERLGATTEEEVYMVVREAMTNSARHSAASQVCVKIWDEDDRVYFSVEDDGVGFALPLPPHEYSHGLSSMKTRMEMLGGQLIIETSPEKGTRVKGFAPLGRQVDE